MFVLTDNNSIASTFIAEMRDVGIQKDSLRFRKNIERLGEIMAYEISKNLSFKNKQIQTPLGIKSHNLLSQQPVICTVMRAGFHFTMVFLTILTELNHHLLELGEKKERKLRLN